ncbi:CLUMA_CG003308, isoform A [Clunio marinus]|uniref:CLUMA_CG003308, isoform A n=1 Tax=Clunio marinus TaxID=568069 RepID=A0A1J1HTS8_9DIPT|nr:CLUMA_CG003308, isoform A [Clunio marinus]
MEENRLFCRERKQKEFLCFLRNDYFVGLRMNASCERLVLWFKTKCSLTQHCKATSLPFNHQRFYSMVDDFRKVKNETNNQEMKEKREKNFYKS